VGEEWGFGFFSGDRLICWVLRVIYLSEDKTKVQQGFVDRCRYFIYTFLCEHCHGYWHFPTIGAIAILFLWRFWLVEDLLFYCLSSKMDANKVNGDRTY
jgi:hypothetical protein